MTIPQDFKEFIGLLKKHNVRYLIVGGYAVGFYSRPKYTEDIDIWVDCNESNAIKVLNVLREFGFGELDISVEDLSNPNMVFQLGYAPLRIDIMTGVSGLNFKESLSKSLSTKYFGIDVNIISLEDLIKNKKESGRKKDLYDIDWLEQYSQQDKSSMI